MVAARGGSGQAAPAPSGTAVQGPGVHVFTVTAAGQSCTTTVTIVPCPDLLPKGRDVTLQTPAAPGAAAPGCAASPVRAADLVNAASLGVSAESVMVRANTKAAWAAAPTLKPGSYFVQVTYPGGLVAATKVPVRVLTADKSPPALVRAAGGGGAVPAGTLCTYPKRAGALSACLPVKSIATATDNCAAPTAIKTSLAACSGCSSGGGTTAAKACVAVGARAVVRVSAVDSAGNAGTLDVPILAYKDLASVPAGAKCTAGDPESARRSVGRRRGTLLRG